MMFYFCALVDLVLSVWIGQVKMAKKCNRRIAIVGDVTKGA